MKLILAIVNNDDSAVVSSALTKEGFFVTKLSTTGGFLMVGNTTLLVGTEDGRIEEFKEILKQYCSTRKKVSPTSDSLGRAILHQGVEEEVVVGGATFFVLNVESFDKI